MILYYIYFSETAQYRFNATSQSFASNRTPLAKISNSIEYALMGSNSGLNLSSKKTWSEQFTKNDNKGAYFTDYKCPPIGS